MSRDEAKRWMTRQPGDNPTGWFVSDTDVMSLIDQVYDDMPGGPTTALDAGKVLSVSLAGVPTWAPPLPGVFQPLPPVADAAALPTAGNRDGDTRITLDDYRLHVWAGGQWHDVGPSSRSHAQITFSSSAAHLVDPPGAADGDLIIIDQAAPDQQLSVWRRQGGAWGQFGSLLNELPVIDPSHEGWVLSVSRGTPQWAIPPTDMPAHSAADVGKQLTVGGSGALVWTPGTGPGAPVTDWSATDSYARGDVVLDSHGGIWVALAAVAAGQPAPASGAVWDRVQTVVVHAEVAGKNQHDVIAVDSAGRPVVRAFTAVWSGGKWTPGGGLAFGVGAGLNNTGPDSLLVGPYAGADNTGTQVVAVGFQAGMGNTGQDLVAVGANSATNNTGARVVAFGSLAANSNHGSYVFAAGFRAAENNSAGNVVAAGQTAAQHNTGEGLIAIGEGAGNHNAGADVIALGHAAQTNPGKAVDHVIALGENAASTTPKTVQLFDPTMTGATLRVGDATYLSVPALKNVVAGAADWAAFKTAIAAL